ncbi:MAG: hypothetical protein IJK33_02525 [Clostridia bacterium]|nr:hypothetical protein [Clostridia bacterium]
MEELMRKIKLKPIKQLKYPKGTRIIFMTDAAQFYAYKVGEHERQTLEDFRRRFQSLLNDEWRN